MAFVVFAVFVIAAFYFWGSAAYFMVRAVIHRKPEVSMWSSETFFNPINLIFMPDKLTPVGMSYRKRGFSGLTRFFACVLLAVVVGTVFKLDDKRVSPFETRRTSTAFPIGN